MTITGLFLVCAAAAMAAERPRDTAVANLVGSANGSAISGWAEFSAGPGGGLDITVRLKGLPPGAHGLHIHEFGDCSDDGKAAGGHYNPLGSPHGEVLKDGLKKAHAGDFGNLVAAADGAASFKFHLKGVSLSGGKHAVAGRALIVHEKADDFGQPAGNAGERIACGAILLGPLK